MFDVLVLEPVLSYASHIWGPMMFAQRLHNTPYNTRAEKVHTSFLRMTTGSIKGIATNVLYQICIAALSCTTGWSWLRDGGPNCQILGMTSLDPWRAVCGVRMFRLPLRAAVIVGPLVF
jgi:hypothetical protein